MKALLRAAAVLSFGFFLVGGLMILGLACLNGPQSDSAVVAAVGLFFIGTAFFVGPLLLATAERLGRKADGK
jgi:hypothetical protein